MVEFDVMLPFSQFILTVLLWLCFPPYHPVVILFESLIFKTKQAINILVKDKRISRYTLHFNETKIYSCYKIGNKLF
jgi:hypothetical protein